tara:strand:+ start:1286 stop:1450 length:165 start_codon:yes stop_codon:yes gene_type:complete
MKIAKTFMDQLSMGAIFVNICLFFFGVYAASFDLQVLSLGNISLFLLYFILTKR